MNVTPMKKCLVRIGLVFAVCSPLLAAGAPKSAPTAPTQPETVLPAGTQITVRLAQALDTRRNRAGDRFPDHCPHTSADEILGRLMLARECGEGGQGVPTPVTFEGGAGQPQRRGDSAAGSGLPWARGRIKTVRAPTRPRRDGRRH